MKTLICFDIDGVLKQHKHIEYVSGPVDTDILEALQEEECLIALVSPSPYHPVSQGGLPKYLKFAKYESNDYRHMNLIEAAKFFETKHQINLKLYVSDNGDWKEAKKAGFVYVDAQMFANAWATIHGGSE